MSIVTGDGRSRQGGGSMDMRSMLLMAPQQERELQETIVSGDRITLQPLHEEVKLPDIKKTRISMPHNFIDS